MQVLEGEGRMKAVIPAAGYATRLFPLTKNFPKALLEVKGRPIVDYVVDKLNELGVEEIFLVTNSRYFPYFQEWAKDKNIKIVDDKTSSNEERLGQVGDILFVIDNEKLDDDIIVVAGDNVFDFSLKDAHEVFKNRRAVVNPLFDCGDFNTAKQLGTVVLDDKNKFVGFFEKSPEPKTTLASSGIYFIPKNKVSLMKQYVDEGNNPDKMGNFLIWLMSKEAVFGHVYKGKWFDIGIKDVLDKAREEFKHKTS